jgi:hypothetical protein
MLRFANHVFVSLLERKSQLRRRERKQVKAARRGAREYDGEGGRILYLGRDTSGRCVGLAGCYRPCDIDHLYPLQVTKRTFRTLLVLFQ